MPPKDLRELRNLVRYRTSLVEARSAERNRLLKLLEEANIKISTFITDVFGVSGMLMLKALLRGDASPAEMAALARGRLRKKMPDLMLALDGRIDDSHRFILQMELDRLETMDESLAKLDARIREKTAPFQVELDLLVEIPGVDFIVASIFIAEAGVDMSVFKSGAHFASWAGLCPGNNESAGKQSSGRTRKGNVHLRTALVQAAMSAARKRGSYFKAKFHSIKARRGYKRAAVAMAHRLLITAHHLLSNGEAYRELGDAYLDTRARATTTRRLVARLEQLGHHVELRLAETE